MIRVKQIRTSEDYDMVVKLGQQDGHNLVLPTHMVSNGNNIVGALTIAPLVSVWMDSTKTQVRDSLQLRAFYEDYLAANGNRLVFVPCLKTSPYFQYMEKDDYINTGEINLFLKGL